MTHEQLMGLVRHLLTSIGGAGVLFGYIDETMVAQIVSAVMVVVGFFWSFAAKK